MSNWYRLTDSSSVDVSEVVGFATEKAVDSWSGSVVEKRLKIFLRGGVEPMVVDFKEGYECLTAIHALKSRIAGQEQAS